MHDHLDEVISPLIVAKEKDVVFIPIVLSS